MTLKLINTIFDIKCNNTVTLTLGWRVEDCKHIPEVVKLMNACCPVEAGIVAALILLPLTERSLPAHRAHTLVPKVPVHADPQSRIK